MYLKQSLPNDLACSKQNETKFRDINTIIFINVSKDIIILLKISYVSLVI